VSHSELLRPPILPACSGPGKLSFIRRRATTYLEGQRCVYAVFVISIVLHDCDRSFLGSGAVSGERTAFLLAARALRYDVQRKALRRRVSEGGCGNLLYVSAEEHSRQGVIPVPWLASVLALESGV
jgi:hypothetical protein